jgi:hypothetical protein
LQRILAIREKALSLNAPRVRWEAVAAVLGILAEMYRAQGRHAEAEAQIKRSLGVREKAPRQ